MQSNHISKELSSGKGWKVEAEEKVKEIRSRRRTGTSTAGPEEEEGHEPGSEGDF